MVGWLQRLKERCKTCSRLTLVLIVAVPSLLIAGTLMAGGAAGLAWTNKEQFCIGCHEMKDNVYQEYKDTIHSVNRTGVRAICSDCHVPREPGPMLVAKMRATFELWDHIVGSVDTPEKFEAKRAELAHNVWRRMKETDSLECRNCHREEAWSADLQSEKSKARHAKGKTEGKTCIDCHYGIAHNEPEGPGPQELFGPGGKPISAPSK
jgi:cytochrome c-type protein NapC